MRAGAKAPERTGDETMCWQRENTPELETARLILRRFNENDLDALYEIYRDEEVNTFLPWFPLKSKAEARAFYEETYAKAYRQPRGYRYAVCLKSDGVPVGYVHVGADDSCDLGYGLQKRFWNRGIITEAAGAVADRLREDGLQYVTATHDVDNPRSGAVMKKIGMRYRYTYEEWWKPKNRLVTFRMYQLNFDGQEDRVYKKYWEQSAVRYIEASV